MSVIDSVKSALFVNIHPKGRNIIYVAVALTILLYILSDTLGTIALILTAFSIYFFRDPDRTIPQGEGFVVANADGKIVAIEEGATLPSELGIETEEAYTRISIYLSLFDVHVNRAPVDGEMIKEVYVPGKFLNAQLDKSSDENERSIAAIKTEKEEIIGFSQIAGMVTRRVVNSAFEGDILKRGERYGIIRFGSRCEVFVPKSYTPTVGIGSRVVAGETIIAAYGRSYKPTKLTFETL
jgi:phosphatidylserine decarboxylase